MTNDADIRIAKSIVDYVFRWFGKKFLTTDQQEAAGILSPEVQGAAGGAVQRRVESKPAEAGLGGRPAWPDGAASTRGKTRSSAPSAAGGWSGPGLATRAATAELTPGVAN